MIKKIEYIANKNVSGLTGHALFSHITNQELGKKKINGSVTLPEYKVVCNGRRVTIWVNENDFPDIEHKFSYEFKHQGDEIKLILSEVEEFEVPENRLLKANDYVFAEGIISYAKKLSTPRERKVGNRVIVEKNICPINFDGTFVPGERQNTLNYLSKATGIDLFNQQIDQRNFRFEMIPYWQFGNANSKSNKNEFSFQNVFYFKIEGFVNNEEKSNAAQYCSIGRKRSYGFGNVNIIKSNYEQETI